MPDSAATHPHHPTRLDGSRRRGAAGRGATRGATALAARSWTGRSALSAVTDSALPHLVTSGTHRTRVSGMRLSANRDDRPRPIVGVPVHPVVHARARESGALQSWSG